MRKTCLAEICLAIACVGERGRLRSTGRSGKTVCVRFVKQEEEVTGMAHAWHMLLILYECNKGMAHSETRSAVHSRVSVPHRIHSQCTHSRLMFNENCFAPSHFPPLPPSSTSPSPHGGNEIYEVDTRRGDAWPRGRTGLRCCSLHGAVAVANDAAASSLSSYNIMHGIHERLQTIKCTPQPWSSCVCVCAFEWRNLKRV